MSNDPTCKTCGKPRSIGCDDPDYCELAALGQIESVDPAHDPQTIADLRAQIEQQAETIAAFERVVEMRDQRIAELLAELEGRAKGTEQ